MSCFPGRDWHSDPEKALPGRGRAWARLTPTDSSFVTYVAFFFLGAFYTFFIYLLLLTVRNYSTCIIFLLYISSTFNCGHFYVFLFYRCLVLFFIIISRPNAEGEKKVRVVLIYNKTYFSIKESYGFSETVGGWGGGGGVATQEGVTILIWAEYGMCHKAPSLTNHNK